jgi:hypothetical protein
MKKNIIIILSLSLLVLTLGIENHVFALSPNDFIPPAEGGSNEVAGKVTEENGVIAAETAQDGFNHANQELDFVQQNFKTVEFPSGIGFLAGASHSYQIHENPDATMLEKRLAYVIAYTKAKAELARGLRGGESRAQEKLLEHMDNVITSTDTVANIAQGYEEDIVQATEALLRGYVIYDVRDNQNSKTVSVTIASSNKTIAAAANISGGLVQSASINEGLDYILKQVNNGLVPPMGGRVITVPATGETAIVSFGSDIIRHHDNSNVEATMRQAAQRAAKMRALDAMVGIIEGDEMAWQGGLMTSQEFQSQDYEEIRNNNGEIVERRILAETKQTFTTQIQQTDAYQSFREGRFPPGVNTKLFEDGSWMYAVSVYLPSMSQKAEDFYEKMQNPEAGSSGGGEKEGKVLSDEYKSGDNEAEQGPSGEVSPSEEL